MLTRCHVNVMMVRSICELVGSWFCYCCDADFFPRHIVSNVGRVVARDSSRAIANGQDLFIALCEDTSIYGLFKNMAGEYHAFVIRVCVDVFIFTFQVYAQIEALSKMPRSRRSMSIATENDGAPSAVRRNSSIHLSRTRLSSESVNNAPASTAQPSRSSSRAVKMLYNKVSQDFVNGSDPGHRKMDSFASANTKQSLASKSDRSPISPTFSVCSLLFHFFFVSFPNFVLLPRRIRVPKSLMT